MQRRRMPVVQARRASFPMRTVGYATPAAGLGLPSGTARLLVKSTIARRAAGASTGGPSTSARSAAGVIVLDRQAAAS
jgi:hypothetical protein